MLESLHLKNVGPASEFRLEAAERLNLLTGDNGLGKSFLLDVTWWALTGTWVSTPALPLPSKEGEIQHLVQGKAGASELVSSTFRREDASWRNRTRRQAMPGIAVYIRSDGGFSVWDPARNFWSEVSDRASAYHFTTAEAWDGLTVRNQRACEGLERDWVSWQERRKPQFRDLEEVMRVLSSPAERLRAGTPRRLFLGEGRERPTLFVGGQEIPAMLASAGVRRVLALAYFLVWAWYEHRFAAELMGREPDERFVILFDEPETHLHPRWQGSIVPSLLAVVDALRGAKGPPAQLFIATHSPLVLASIEPMFSPALDKLLQLPSNTGEAKVESKELKAEPRAQPARGKLSKNPAKTKQRASTRRA